VPDATSNANETFATEVEQYTFDQSLANEENVGMMAAVFANLIILAIAIAAIAWYAQNKKRKKH